MKPDTQPPTPGTARILIVDDEKSIRLVLRAFLEKLEGYEVDLAEDVHQAWALLMKGAFDVVVTDIVLPGLSGVELLQMIRAAAPDVQVILMTGMPTAETASAALRGGARDYLVKPIDRGAFQRAVMTAVHIRRIEAENRRLAAENLRCREALAALAEQRPAADPSAPPSSGLPQP